MKSKFCFLASACLFLSLGSSAWAQAFPPPATDSFGSTTTIVITINNGPDAGVYPATTFTGPISIFHGTPNGAGTQVPLTMTSLNLSGNVPGLGQVTIQLNGNGTGSATSLGSPGFPASTTMSVPYRLITPNATFTGGPHVISNSSITAFPPFADGSYSVATSNFGGAGVTGVLASPFHQPTLLTPLFGTVGLLILGVLLLLVAAWAITRTQARPGFSGAA